MLTKNKIKFIRSLANKKERYSHQQFIIEGEKIVNEALNIGIPIDELIIEENYRSQFLSTELTIASKKDMERCSSMKQAPGVLAVLPFLSHPKNDFNKGKYILLDRINDPGNLGSIIRIADWFSIDGIICSNDSVDVYNPKVVQASMGSILRVPVWYNDLSQVIANSELKVIAADLEGEDVNSFVFPQNAMLLMGSESHGINDELLALIDYRVTIPKKGLAESLNLSVATGILCEKFSNS